MPATRPIIAPLLVLFFAGLAGIFYAWANVDSYAKQIIKQKLNEILQHGDFVVDMRAAQFVAGEGIEIRGLRLIDSQNGDQPIAQAQSVFVRFPTDVNSLLAGRSKPTSIDVEQFQLRLDESEVQRHLLTRVKEVIKHKPPDQLIPVRLRNSKLLLRPIGSREFIQFAELQADVTPEIGPQTKIIRWLARANNDIVEGIEVVGALDMNDLRWMVRWNQGVIHVGEPILSLLSRHVNFDLRYLNGIHGQVAVQGEIQSRRNGLEPLFNFRGTVDRLQIRNSDLPVEIENCRAQVRLDNQQLVVEKATGLAGSGRFEIQYQQQGLLAPNSWQLKGRGDQIYFDSKYEPFLNQNCQKFCRDFSPYGVFDVEFELNSSGQKKVSADIRDMSFSYQRFPYRVDHCVGKVDWINQDLNFSIQAFEKQQLLEFWGQVNNPGKRATYTMNFGTDGRLPIDEKAIRSLSQFPGIEQAIRDMRANGYVGGRGRLVKSDPNSSYVRKDIRIGLHDGHVRHRKFDYPIQNVNGNVRFEDDAFEFRDFTGVSGSTNVKCNGHWNKRDGLDLNFDCYHVDLNDRLRNALTPSLQEIWNGMRPSGKVQFGRVFLDLPPGADFANIRVQAQLGGSQDSNDHDSVSIFPIWFPYRIDRIQGQVQVGDGKIVLDKIAGQHGRTWLNCDGHGSYDSKAWNVRLTNILAGSIALDEELLSALPINLANAIRQLSYQGRFNLSGGFGFSGSNVSEFVSAGTTNGSIRTVSYETQTEPVSIDWDVRLDINQGKMLVGLPLDNIFGSVRLNGTSKGDQSRCQGEVSVDSLTIYDLQVTNIQGPIWIDNLQTQAGKFARTQTGKSESLRGNFGKGRVTFDGWVANDNQFPFYLQSTIEHTKLEEVAAAIYPEMRELSGDGFGFVKLQGNANALHTYAGEGSVHLKNARIHQLPIILSLLKILNIKEINRTAFDSSNVDFSIKGNRMKLDRIELIGDAISLIGNGYLELMRHVDVNFYSVVGRNRLYIPLISELYTAGSQRIMWVNIGGPLGDLQTTRKVLPGLDDSLRKLLGTSGIDANAQIRN